jgi:hypothetical protein
MENKLTAFGTGIKTLTLEQAANVDLGPLAGLVGEWVSPKDKPFGWNVIAVPGPRETQGFTLEVIPYTETLTFTPVVVAGNRGPVINGVQQDQNIVGLMYNQTIHSLCETDLCKKMGFESGQEIHAETGLFLYMSNLSPQFSIARLSTIPHGNSVLALGNAIHSSPVSSNDFFGTAPIAPRAVPGTPPLGNGYGEFQYQQHPQFPGVFNQSDPNTFLRETLGNAQVADMTTLHLSTDNKDGGILNIPFIRNHVDATRLDATFWIQTIETSNGSFQQLQYSQTIDLVFPATGFPQPIIWPHVTINTLRRP